MGPCGTNSRPHCLSSELLKKYDVAIWRAICLEDSGGGSYRSIFASHIVSVTPVGPYRIFL